MKNLTLGGALVALAAASCSGRAAATSAPSAVADCDVLASYLDGVASRRPGDPLPQLAGFQSSCAVDGASPGGAIVCRFATTEEAAVQRYDEVTDRVASCLSGWGAEHGDTDPSGAPETYRWTTLREAGTGATVDVRLHYYQDRLSVDVTVPPR